NRKGLTATNAYGDIDMLSYSYQGNQLTSVSDAIPTNFSSTEHFAIETKDVAIEVVGVVGAVAVIGGPCGTNYATILGILQAVEPIIGEAIAHDFVEIGESFAIEDIFMKENLHARKS
ncbi:MAG: hypothetical protein AAFY76_12385, partial [Cyanobacteria bacterium J06649_11]